jgi:hypothetical protein
LPLTALIIAPILDIVLKSTIVFPMTEIPTFISVSTSLIFSIIIGRIRPKRFSKLFLKAKPWNYSLMIFGIITFLNIFRASGIIQILEETQFTIEIIYCLGFLSGFATGRIITPAGIIFPLILEKFGSINFETFALIYFGIVLGYMITPVHPCISLSIKTFNVQIKDFLRTLTPPVTIAFLASFIMLFVL